MKIRLRLSQVKFSAFRRFYGEKKQEFLIEHGKFLNKNVSLENFHFFTKKNQNS